MLRRSLLPESTEHRGESATGSLHSLAKIVWPLGVTFFFATDLAGLTGGGWAVTRGVALIASSVALLSLAVEWARSR
jgi:hypothetical protein